MMRKLLETQAEFDEAVGIARSVAHKYLAKGLPEAALDDVAQEAITRLLAQDPPPSNWQAWLNTASGRIAIDMLRKDKPGLRDDEPGEDASPRKALERFLVEGIPTSAQPTLSDQIDRLLAGLSDRDRDLLWASVDGRSRAELAEEFGMKNAAVVSSTLDRIRRTVVKEFLPAELDLDHPRIY